MRGRKSCNYTKEPEHTAAVQTDVCGEHVRHVLRSAVRHCACSALYVCMNVCLYVCMYVFTRFVSAQCCATPCLCVQHALKCPFFFLAVRGCRVHDRCRAS